MIPESTACQPAGLPRELITAAYARLRRIAWGHVGADARRHTLGPTALVNEALVRILQSKNIDVRGEEDLCGLLSTVMRRVLVDHARSRRSRLRRESEIASRSPQTGTERHLPHSLVLGLHDLINRLSLDEPDAARAIEMHYFGGMPTKDIAEALGVSIRTVQLDLALARQHLKTELIET